MWEPVAFCCFSRRTGSILLGAWDVVISLVQAIFVVILLSTPFMEYIDGVCHDSCPHNVELIVDIAAGVTLVFAIMHFLFACLMIHGVRKMIPGLMYPYMILHLIQLVLCGIVAVLYIIIFAIITPVVMFAYAYIMGALIFLWVYRLLCVRAHCFEIKRASGESHTKLVESPHSEFTVIKA